jgi:hypothetical protein
MTTPLIIWGQTILCENDVLLPLWVYPVPSADPPYLFAEAEMYVAEFKPY